MLIHATDFSFHISSLSRPLTRLQLKGKATNAAVDIESVDESRPFIEMVRVNAQSVCCVRFDGRHVSPDQITILPLADLTKTKLVHVFVLPCH
jgi:hypothetical protein